MSSALTQGLYDSESPQGAIAGKGFADHDEFDTRAANCTNGYRAAGSYGGGENPANLHILAGELSIGRTDGNLYVTSGEANERGFTSLSGFYWKGYVGGLEAAMRFHYFQGLVTSEYLVGSDTQGESGYAFNRAGTGSTVNNGDGDIYAGDLIEWYFPDVVDVREDPHRPAGVDSRLAFQNRAGTPAGKVLVCVRRFDPYKFHTCLSGAWALISNPPQARVFTDLYKKVGISDATNMPSLEEEALGLENALLAIGMLIARQINRGDLGINRNMGPQDMAQALGLWTADGLPQVAEANRNLRKRVLGPIFRSHIVNATDRDRANQDLLAALGAITPEDFAARIKEGQETRNPAALLAKLCADPLGMLMGAITSAQQARRSRIIGKAISSAARSDTLHLMIGHFRNC